jgi:hypothetical protein
MLSILNTKQYADSQLTKNKAGEEPDVRISRQDSNAAI